MDSPPSKPTNHPMPDAGGRRRVPPPSPPPSPPPLSRGSQVTVVSTDPALSVGSSRSPINPRKFAGSPSIISSSVSSSAGRFDEPGLPVVMFRENTEVTSNRLSPLPNMEPSEYMKTEGLSPPRAVYVSESGVCDGGAIEKQQRTDQVPPPTKGRATATPRAILGSGGGLSVVIQEEGVSKSIKEHFEIVEATSFRRKGSTKVSPGFFETAPDTTNDFIIEEEKAISNLFFNLNSQHGVNKLYFLRATHIENERCAPKQAYYHSELMKILNDFGVSAVHKCLIEWPDDSKNKFWFVEVIRFAFRFTESKMPFDMLTKHYNEESAGIINSLEIYKDVFHQLEKFNAINSVDGFQDFMNWLICWDVFHEHSCIELLEKIPVSCLEMRPDLPQTKKTQSCSHRCDGLGDTRNLREYLTVTKWQQNYMLEALMTWAPLDHIDQTIDYWLKSEDIKKLLFIIPLHPYTLDMKEPAPWHCILCGIDRLLADSCNFESDSYSQLTATQEDIKYSAGYLEELHKPSSHLLFGRTVKIAQKKHSTVNKYLKFQDSEETEKELKLQFKKLKYFCDTDVGLDTTFVVPRHVFNITDFKEFLVSTYLTEREKGQLILRCQSGIVESVNSKISSDDDFSTILRALKATSKTYWYRLLEEKSPLSPSIRTKFIDHLLTLNSSLFAILFETNKSDGYECYVSDEQSEEVIAILEKFASNCGCLWSQRICGPDACSISHDQTNRQCIFLTPYYEEDNDNVGAIKSWKTISIDFPNVGTRTLNVRDIMDACSFSNLPINSKYYSELSKERLIARQALTKLNDSVWGITLLLCNSEDTHFDHTSQKQINDFTQKLSRPLALLYSQAFGFSIEQCIKLMNELNFLYDSACQMNYWMTEAYISDLDSGKIPVSVYPNYKGVRTVKSITPFIRENLIPFRKRKNKYDADPVSNDIGYQGGGQNPLLSFQGLTVFMLAKGCMKKYKEAKIAQKTPFNKLKA